METAIQQIRYPDRVVRRAIMRSLISFIYSMIMDIKIIGEENLPKSGPLIIVSNHFHFLDPVTFIRVLPYPIEFIGGYRTPNAPAWTEVFRVLYGVLHVRRGASSRDSIKAAQSVLEQNGTLAIFPEGGSWATVLRPARPGTALLAVRTGAPILPIGIDGSTDVFPSIAKGKPARVTVTIGKPYRSGNDFDPGLTMREKMDEMGHEMMRHIRDLIPPERHGCYSDDPVVREAAQGTEIYPWEGVVEE